MHERPQIYPTSVRLPYDMWKHIKSVAKSQGVSVNTLIVRMLAEPTGKSWYQDYKEKE